MNRDIIRSSCRTTPMVHKRPGNESSVSKRKHQLNMCMQHFKEKRANYFSDYRTNKTPLREIHRNCANDGELCDITPDTSKESLSLLGSPSSTVASFSCLAKQLLHEVRNCPMDSKCDSSGDLHVNANAYLLDQSTGGLKDHSKSSPIKYSNHDWEILPMHMQGTGCGYGAGAECPAESNCLDISDHTAAMEILDGGSEHEEDYDDVDLLEELELLLKCEYDQMSMQCYLESMDDDYLIEQYEHEKGVDEGEYSIRHSIPAHSSGNHEHLQFPEGSDGELLCPCCQSHIMHPLVSTDMNMGIINPSSEQSCDMLFCFNCSASLYIHRNVEHMMDLLSGVYEKHACSGKHCHIRFYPHGKGRIKAHCVDCNFLEII